MSSSSGHALVVSDSDLGDVVRRKLAEQGYTCVRIQEWRSHKTPLAAIVFCTEAALKEPRKRLNKVSEFQDQWNRLMEVEVKQAFELAVEAFPSLTQHFKTTGVPGSIIFLGSKVVRSPNSPQQIVSSVVKRSLMTFSGSLFFEKRADGIRVSCVNPGPNIPPEVLADSLVFPLQVGKTACVEALDLSTVKSFAGSSPKKWGACFVTGGSRGIGKSIAVRIAKEFKMPVALVGRDEAALKQTREECAQFVGDSNVMTFAFDVRDSAKLKSSIDSVADRFGGLSVLVCSAGINRRANAVSADGTKIANPKVWQELMDINYNSAVYATQYSLPHMIRRPEGPSIFYIGSRTIRVGGSPGQQAYVASKMAIAGFAQSVQHEVKNFGVRVVALNVGLVSTELGNKVPKVKNFVPAPPETQIQPEDVAEAVSFTLRMDPGVSPMAFDICGMTDEFLDKDGKALKMSNL